MVSFGKRIMKNSADEQYLYENLFIKNGFQDTGYELAGYNFPELPSIQCTAGEDILIISPGQANELIKLIKEETNFIDFNNIGNIKLFDKDEVLTENKKDIYLRNISSVFIVDPYFLQEKENFDINEYKNGMKELISNMYVSSYMQRGISNIDNTFNPYLLLNNELRQDNDFMNEVIDATYKKQSIEFNSVASFINKNEIQGMKDFVNDLTLSEINRCFSANNDDEQSNIFNRTMNDSFQQYIESYQKAMEALYKEQEEVAIMQAEQAYYYSK